MKIKAVLVDDELNNLDNLQALLRQYCPEIVVVAIALDAAAARKIIIEQSPDLVFLDIQMPGQSGLQAAHSIRVLNPSTAKRPHLVFVTAYEQYAVKAFEAGAIDYVLKPYDHARLSETVLRLKERLNNTAPSAAEQPGLQALLE